MTAWQLTAADELWEQYDSTRDAEVKHQIIFRYLYIVGIVVNRLMPQYRDYSEKDELMSCGVLGLIDAVDKFDKTLGVQFQTYATARIRGEILDYLREQDWAPTSLRRRINDIRKASEVIESLNGAKPTDREIADYLGIETSAVRKTCLRTRMFNIVCFETLQQGQERQAYLGDIRGDPCQIIEEEDLADTLRKLIDELPERKKRVILLRYYEGMPIKSIAKKCGFPLRVYRRSIQARCWTCALACRSDDISLAHKYKNKPEGLKSPPV